MNCFMSLVNRGLRGTVLISLALLALCSFSLLGQETTGKVAGRVLDPSGAAVPNAKVELSGGALPSGYTVVTTTGGDYTFSQVPIGNGYKVSVTASGFRTATKSNLSVTVGVTAFLEVKLEVGQITETVVVAADAAMVDTSSSSSAVTVDSSFFDMLPKGRSFYDLISIAPGARAEGKSGGVQIDGASGSENTYYLDGMEVTSIQSGVLDGQNRIPVEFVQQLQVKNGVTEAQYGGAMGGVVSAVVKSGSNEFHGEVGTYFNNDAMQARPRVGLELDPFDDNKALYYQNTLDSYKTWNPVFNFGGPLIKNKLFMFAAYAPTKTSYDRSVNFTTGQSGKYHETTAQQYLAGKVDYVPFSKLRVNASWIWNPYKQTGEHTSVAGTDSYTNNWAQQGSYTSGNFISGQVDYLASSRLIISFHGGWSTNNNNNNYGIPQSTAVYYSGKSIGVAGIPAALQAPAGWVTQAVGFTKYNRYDRKNYSADASYMFNFHGQHTIKGGWQMNQISNDIFSTSYPNGYYRYYWNLKYGCVVSTAAACTAGKGAYGYYRYRVLGTIGDAGSNNQGMFLQDNWRVNKRLSLQLGLRSEREFVPSFSSNKSLPSAAITFDWAQKVSPRIGFAYDLKGDGKQKLYGSFGLFYDVMKYELPRGSFGGDVWKEWYFTLDDPNVVTSNKGFPADPTKLPGTLMETIDWRIPSNDPSQHLIEPNLKPMKQQMFDLGYDFSLNPTLVASVRYTNRRLIRTIEDTGYLTSAGETYIIANPSEGVTGNVANWESHWGPGIPLPPKPTRNYDAVEVRLDKRFSKSYQFSASYTLSRQYGNYSGLASSDENGRTSPNVNRYYDEPWVGVMETGKYAYGRLATDRPNTFKFFGGYTKKTILGSTTLSPNIQLYSGTPITTEAPLVSSTPAFPYGRGDLGRTPFYYNIDLNLSHELAPMKNHEAVRVRFEFSVFNLLNTSIVTDKYKTITHQNDGYVGFDDYASIFTGYNLKSLMAAQSIRQDPEYGLPTAFQSPRSARIQISFFF